MIKKILLVFLLSLTFVNAKTALKKRTPTIGVLPFIDNNPIALETGYGASIASMLQTHLRNETNFIVLERSELNEVLDEKALEQMEVTQSDREKLQKLLSVEVLLSGSVSELGGIIQIDCRLISMLTGKVVVAEFVEIQKINSLRKEISSLAKTIELKYLRQWMGNLKVSAAPTEGEVYLDGNFVGKASAKKPLQINKLLEGDYNLRVIAGGYKEFKEQIHIAAKSSIESNVILQSLPGKLKVNSSPVGATVSLNNKIIGKTPITLSALEEGRYSLKLSMDNFQTRTKTASIKPGQLTEVNEALEVVPGSLKITSEPSNAIVYLNKNKLGVTPLLVENVKPQNYNISLHLDKHVKLQKNISVKPGETLTLFEQFVKQKGKLTLVSEQAKSKLTLYQNEKIVLKKELPLHKHKLEIGKYKAIIERKDHHPQTIDIIINQDQEVRHQITLQKKPGELILTAPHASDYYINEVYQGHFIGQVIALEEGSHKLIIETSFGTVKKEFEITANQKTNLSIQSPSRSPDKWWLPTIGLLLITIFVGGF